MDIVTLLGGTVIGAGTVGSVARYLIVRWLDKRDKDFEENTRQLQMRSAAEMQEIKARVAKVEDGCNAHKQDTFSARMDTRLTRIEQTMERVETTVNSTNRDVAGLQKFTETHENYIHSVHQDLKSHVGDHRVHGG
jgi:archaellum component FlaC